MLVIQTYYLTCLLPVIRLTLNWSLDNVCGPFKYYKASYRVYSPSEYNISYIQNERGTSQKILFDLSMTLFNFWFGLIFGS